MNKETEIHIDTLLNESGLFPQEETNHQSKIHFDFSKPDELVFNLVNNYEDIEHTNKKNSGIGISNVKQRLKYLYNQKDYSLSVDKLNGVFTVKLKLG